MAYPVHQGEKIARPSWPASLLENAKFFCARLARASAPEREGAEGSIDASDGARAGGHRGEPAGQNSGAHCETLL